MRLPLSLLLPFLFAQAACWGPRYFAPREHVTGSGPSGHPAATYAIQSGDASRALGEVRIWSSGARARSDEAGDDLIELHVGFEIENTGQEPLELDLARLQCEELVASGAVQAPFLPQKVDGTAVAQPGTTARVDAIYWPAVSKPKDIDRFAVRFHVRVGEVDVLQQVTPFGRHVASVPASDLYWNGYTTAWVGTQWAGWAPGWGPGWGPGPGFGWGVGWGPGWWGPGGRYCR